MSKAPPPLPVQNLLPRSAIRRNDERDDEFIFYTRTSTLHLAPVHRDLKSRLEIPGSFVYKGTNNRCVYVFFVCLSLLLLEILNSLCINNVFCIIV